MFLALRKPSKAIESESSPNLKPNNSRSQKIIQIKPKNEKQIQSSSTGNQLDSTRGRVTPTLESSFTKANYIDANTQTHAKGFELLSENESFQNENEKLKNEMIALRSSSFKKGLFHESKSYTNQTLEKESNEKIALLQTKLKLAEINLDSLILAQQQK